MAEVREITEQFRLEKVLKSSPGGVVFRATDPGTGHKVAIKLINRGSSPDQEVCRQHFLAAVRALQELRAPCFPTVHDFGLTPDGTAFIVMEMLEGVPVTTLVGSAPARILSLLGPLVDGLQALAARGFLHHNLSPDNLLLVHGRAGDEIKVLGFGTAAFRPEGPAPARTPREGLTFQAPELLHQPGVGGPADWRSDLYSLNLIVCHLLGARVTPPDFPEVDLPPSVREGLHDPEPLRLMLLSGLRHSPDQRPASYDAVRQAFMAALNGGAVGPGVTAPIPETIPGPSAPLSEPGLPAEDDLGRTMPVQVLGFATPGRPGGPEPTEAAAAASVAPEPAGEPTLFELDEEPPTPEPPVLPLLDEEEVAGVARLEIEQHTEGTSAPPEPESAAEPIGDEGPAPGPLTGPQPVGPPEPVHSVPASRVQTAPIPIVPVVPAPALPAWPAPTALELPVASTLAEEAVPQAPPQPLPPPPPLPVGLGAPPASVEEPAPETPPTGVPGAPPIVPPPAPTAKRKGMPIWPLLLLIPVALVVVAAGIFLVGPRIVGSLLTRPTPVPTPARPTPSPVPRATQPPRGLAQIAEAERLFRADDFDGARLALASVTTEDEDKLAREDFDRLRTLRDELAAQRAGSLTKDLDRGIRNGNVELLKRALAAFTQQDLEGVAGDRKVEQQLELARRAIEVQGQLLQANKGRNSGEVIRVAGTLLGILPKCAQASDLRDRAAATIESEADALVRNGQLDAGIARLEELRKLWAERAGLDRRIERYRETAETERKMTALMAEVAQAERDRRPEHGLELLRGASTGGKWDAAVAEARDRLERLLADLDKGAPVVQLKPGWKAEYEKGKNASIFLKVTDDYGVKVVSVMGRIEGGKMYAEIPVRRGPGTDYIAEVPAAFHKNETIELYVTVTDASGHTGQLGKAEAPIKVKRKRWLF